MRIVTMMRGQKEDQLKKRKGEEHDHDGGLKICRRCIESIVES
jgi:hypothetical protein